LNRLHGFSHNFKCNPHCRVPHKGRIYGEDDAMPSASTIRLQVESALAHRIPSALTPAAKTIRPVATTGIEEIDALLAGGLPIGAVTELVGPDCSGRTSVAASFLARITRASKVCAWIDVSNSFDPPAAAATGLDLERLLWIRCGVSEVSIRRPGQQFRLPEKYLIAPPPKKGLLGGGFGNHPRSEVKGMSDAVSGLLHSDAIAPRCAEPQRHARPTQASFEANYQSTSVAKRTSITTKPWARIDQALRAADLLLQAGGFSAIVLDMASLAPEFVSRVPLATWHRYRMASERTQSSILLLTQHSCAKSSAELLLRLEPSEALGEEETVFTGTKATIEVARQRFAEVPSNVVQMERPSRRENSASWQCRTAWAGPR
jgi:RecA/RadA recombinase